MKKTTLNQTAVDNFLSTMDLTLGKEDHIENAIRDALHYRWHQETFRGVLAGIEKAYTAEES